MDPSEDIDDDAPPVINPYDVLGLPRTATADEVKSAYRKAALKNHPGRVYWRLLLSGLLRQVSRQGFRWQEGRGT